jgi:hypothetical protein
MSKRSLLLIICAVLGLCSFADAELIKLDSNDVTWLWPVPRTADDVDRLINMDELRTSDGNPVWTDQAFADLVMVADSGQAAVRVSDAATRRIGLRPAFRQRSTWKIAAFRVDPAAPGAHASVREQLGEVPQIRLILQPVTIESGNVKVHDFAVHMVFNFVAEPASRRPDREKFTAIVDDLGKLKSLCADAGIATTGTLLGVHPGLASPTTVPALQGEVEAFLGRHLDPARLSAMAVMGLPANQPEPWIFVALVRQTERFVALPIPVFTDPNESDPAKKFKTAQMLSFLDTPHVLPVPRTNNRNPPTAQLTVAPAERRGVSTAPLFESTSVDESATIGLDAQGQPIRDNELRNRDIPDFIANPQVSNFFNTDCVSCHTESHRRIQLNLAASTFGFSWPDGVSALDNAMLPASRWNVRNIGWFPTAQTAATITRRTANETAEVVEFVNREYVSGAADDPD